ncbi:ABC transporter ATP-binding protein [Conexibacter sp. DBS9H8]|uniref:ABC transporter ATP-binding protein n=1 Tax=Conexibacter sp. DBS9H8 TaxID=2937801 RepID=UPI00273A6B81|nr:ABC transporter ATP-binding protein [Conexibacter sp. DBS9H8]
MLSDPRFDSLSSAPARQPQALEADAPLLRLTGVSKTYLAGEVAVHALADVDLSISRGEYLALMGPSGSGKSTLMHILGCLDTPTSGTYVLDGQDVSKLDELELAWIRNQLVGFVFQQFHLLGRQTAARNVELPLLYAGVRSRAERNARTQAALAAVGMADRTEHRPNQLSGGQQQRVAIARALVTDPAIILADEPTGNLGSDQTDEVLEIFHGLHQQGRTVILITHEPDVAGRARRLISVRDGRVVADEPVTR